MLNTVAMTYHCPLCPRELVREYERNWPYPQCGLGNVVLEEVLTLRCPGCRTTLILIPETQGLHLALARTLLHKESLLAGEEVRFLRQDLCWTYDQANGIFGFGCMQAWETGALQQRSDLPMADRLLRLCYVRVKQIEMNVADAFSSIRTVQLGPSKLRASFTPDMVWKVSVQPLEEDE